jgi:hypothetical protein
MAQERATVFETTQVGIEYTPDTTTANPGVVVPAYKRLLAVSIEPKPVIPTVAQRNLGSKFTNSTFNKKEHTQADMKGFGCFQTMVYLLNSLLTTGVITTPGGGTLTRLHTFTPNTYSPDTPLTFTVDSGSSAGAERFPYAVLDSLALRFTEDEVGVSGTWFGQSMVESVTLTPSQNTAYSVNIGDSGGGTFTLTNNTFTTAGIAWNALFGAVQTACNAAFGASSVTVTGLGTVGSPFLITFTGNSLNNTAQILTGSGASLTGGAHVLTVTKTLQGGTVKDITPVPIDPTQLEFLVSTDGTNYTQLGRDFETEWALNNRFSQVMTLDDTTKTFSAVVEKAIGFTVSLVIEHDSVAAGYMTDLRNKTEKWFRILCTGPVIEGALHYLLQIDFPFHFKDNTRGDKKDVWASTYHLEPVYDSSWKGGAALQVQVQNTITAL